MHPLFSFELYILVCEAIYHLKEMFPKTKGIFPYVYFGDFFCFVSVINKSKIRCSGEENPNEAKL